MDYIKQFDEKKQFIFGEGDAVLTKCGDGYTVSGRKEKYSSFAVHILEDLGEFQAFETKIKLKFNGGEDKIAVYHKITMEYLGLTYTVYDRGTAVDVGNEFTEISCYTNVPEGIHIVDIIAYFIQNDVSKLNDVTVAEFESHTAEPIKTTMKNTKSKISFQEKLKFGAVRWDAYFGTTDDGTKSVCNQVTTTLSPAHYHFMAPFFAEYVGKNQIRFPEATQEQFDKEAELAIKAGIDYFAYCWYRDNDRMSYARKHHAASKYGNQIKMSAIINVNALDDETIDTLVNDMKQDYYLRFDNRPVMFLYDSFRVKDGYVEKVIERAKQAGIKEEIYIVGMSLGVDPFVMNTLIQRGCDAVSAYSCDTIKHGEPYTDMTARLLEKNDLKYANSDNIDVIPLISCGRDQRPRIENFVTWCGAGYGDKFAYPPTGEELYLHVKAVLDKIKNEPEKNRPKAVLTYAWNEHDEGGWCCPTMAVDSEGEPIYDENGKILMNCTYLNAVARAIKEFRENE